MITTPPPTAISDDTRDDNGETPDGSGHHKKRGFLAAYGQTGNISVAARAAGIHRQRHYEWLQEADYAKAFDHAKEEAGDILEAEARRRAVEGCEVPVYQGGRKVGTTRRYSDLLLIFLLKGAKPEKYGDKAVSDSDDGKVEVRSMIILQGSTLQRDLIEASKLRRPTAAEISKS